MLRLYEPKLRREVKGNIAHVVKGDPVICIKADHMPYKYKIPLGLVFLNKTI